MIIAIAGLTIAVSAGVPSSYTTNGYAALTYSNIGNISEAGEHGIEYNIVTFNSISNRQTQKFKGSFDYGLKVLDIAYDPLDIGAALLRDGSDSFQDYAFRMTYQDGTVEYFSAKVKSFVRGTGAVDTMKMVTVGLDITNLLDYDVVITGSFLLSGSDMLLANSTDLLLIG